MVGQVDTGCSTNSGTLQEMETDSQECEDRRCCHDEICREY